MKDKLNKKNIKSIIAIVGTFLFIGLCTVGIIKAAVSYDYGSASIAGKVYRNYSDTSKPGQPWGLTMNNIVIEDAVEQYTKMVYRSTILFASF